MGGVGLTRAKNRREFELAQKANDGDFYIMSEIDAKLREQRQKVLDQKKD